MSTASKISVLLASVFLLNSCVNNARWSSFDSRTTVTPSYTSKEVAAGAVSSANPEFYLVKPGDTLYSIAFRFGLDYRKLAAANGIDSQYHIYEGESLALRESPLKTSVSPKPVSSVIKSTPKPKPVLNTKVNSQKNDVDKTDRSPVKQRQLHWKWPHNGKIVRTFVSGSSSQKGIDIKGQIGDSVVAATNGVVVYEGNGLPGYGNLIIIEHENNLLSAYAFTQESFVKEKDKVTTGQKIATMGKQGDQPSLHFEIRHNGKPVDPMGFLPKR